MKHKCSGQSCQHVGLTCYLPFLQESKLKTPNKEQVLHTHTIVTTKLIQLCLLTHPDSFEIHLIRPYYYLYHNIRRILTIVKTSQNCSLLSVSY